MAIKKINTDLQIEAGLLDGDGNSGTNNQILISTGTGIDWVNASTVIGGPYLPLAGGTMTGDLLINTTGGYFQVDVSDNSVKFADNTKAKFGTGNDLQIYHDGSNSYIDDTGTGSLFVRGSDIFIKANTSENAIIARANAAVELYHNNALKLETTSTGVDITGNGIFTGNVGVGGTAGAKFDVNSGTANTVAIFESTDDKAFIIIKDDDTNTHLISKDGKFYIGQDSTSYEKFNVDISNGSTNIGGNLTVNGAVYVANPLNYQFSLASNALITPSYTNAVSTPFGRTWHDTLAFQRNYTVSQETSTDNTSWTSVTTTAGLFVQKDKTKHTVIASGVRSVRWTFTGVAYNVARFIHIASGFSSPTPTCAVTIEYSSDNTNWTTIHTSTGVAFSSSNRYYYVDPYIGNGGRNYCRITIDKGNTDSKVVSLTGVKMLTQRLGDQGKGREDELPFLWDDNKKITLEGGATTNSNSTTIASRKFVARDSNGTGLFADNASSGLSIADNGNATFTGTISGNGKFIIANNGTATWGAANDYGQLSWDTGYALVRGQSGKGIKLQTNSSSTTLTLDTSQNATFAGDVTVAGTITAQEFHTEFVSASIIYDSGSTKFGDTSDDNHDFTGSIKVNSGNVVLSNNNELRWEDSTGTEKRILELVSSDLLELEGPNRIRLLPGGNTAIDLFSGYNTKYTMSSVHSFFDASANEAVRIDGAGNVGIGTTSPQRKLEVVGKIRVSDVIEWGWGGVRIIGSTTTNDFRVQTWNGSSAQDRLIVDGSGNVGIGTTSPGNKLHIKKDDSSESAIIKIEQDGTGDAVIDYLLTSTNMWRVGVDNSDSDSFKWGIGDLDDHTKLRLSTAGNLTAEGTIDADDITIDNWGSVSASLASISDAGGVNGSGTATHITKWVDSDTVTSSGMFQAASGNFSIGITTPNAKLSVVNDISIGTSATDVLRLHNESGVGTIDGYSSRNIAFGSATNGEVMRIDNTNGRVGIGTTSPDASLHVASTTNDYVAKFSHTTATGYAPGSILLQAGQSTSRGQGLFHYNTEADDSWFTGVPYNVASTKWIVAHKPDTTFNPDVAQTSHAIFTIDSSDDSATFAGNITTDTGILDLNISSTNVGIEVKSTTAGSYIRFDDGANANRWYLGAQSGNFGIYNNANEKPFQIDSSKNATFAGTILSKDITISKSSGDAVLVVEADTDNDNENDNPRIELKQDAGAVYSYYGVNGDLNNTFTGALVNHAYLRASTGLQLVTNGSITALTLDTSQNATFAGDVTVAGTITAQEFHTEFVSASILYESGSTKFGDTVDDNHDFTGSLSILAQSGASGIQLDRNSTTYININNSSTRNEFNFKSSAGLRFYHGTDSTSPLFISSSGDVGINKTNPTRPLHVSGIAQIDNGSLQLGGTSNVSGNNPQFRRTNSSNDLAISTGGSDRITVLGGGNVGIGITNPGAKLHIDVVSEDNQPGFKLTKVSDSGENAMEVHHGTSSALRGIADFTNSNGSVMFLRGDGNVGIGTTSPSATFVVQPSETSFNLAGLANGQIALGNNTSSGKAPTIGSRTTSTGQPPLQFITGQPSTSTVPGMIFSVREDNNSDFGSLTNKPAYDFTRYTTSLLRINRDGNVGIGTTGPGAKLDVNGDVYINSNYPSNAAASDLTIGKTTTGDHGLTIVTGASNTAGIFFADNNNNDAGRIKYQHSNNSMRFETNRSEAMRINSTGNVGIGTTNPTYKLDVAGNVNISGTGGYIRWNSGDIAIKNEGSYKLGFQTYNTTSSTLTTKMVLDTDGNVGIGTTTPSSKLEVYGSGSTVLDIQGSQGQLFSITDDLTGTLFAVSDISGVPIFEVEANGEVSIDGDLKIKSANITYQENVDVDSAATETIATVNTGEYTGAFFDYTCVSGSNARVGTVMAISVDGSIEFTDNSTKDIGDTSGVTLSVDLSGSSMRLRASTNTNDWIIKTLIRTL